MTLDDAVRLMNDPSPKKFRFVVDGYIDEIGSTSRDDGKPKHTVGVSWYSAGHRGHFSAPLEAVTMEELP